MEKSINTVDIHLQTTTKTNNDLLTEIIFDVKTNGKDGHLGDEDDYISLDESKDISDTHYIKICMQVGDEIFRTIHISFDKNGTQALRHYEAIDNEISNQNAENIREALIEIREQVDILLLKNFVRI